LEPKKKRSRLYDFIHRDGKGVSKSDVVTTHGLKGFFYRFRLSFSKLISINMIYVFGNVLLLFFILTLAGYTKIPYVTPQNDFYNAALGIQTAQGTFSAADFSMLTVFGQQTTAYANSTLTYVFWAISALTVLTFGCVNAGTAYLLRNLAKGDPIFPISDFFYAVKRNFKQAIPMGIIDAAILCIVPYNIFTMVVSNSGFMTSFMLWMNVAIFIVYFIMRFYIYMLMVTFDLSIFQILKNALIFTMLGIKRNLAALLGIFLLVFLDVVLLLSGAGFLLPLALAIPVLFLFAVGAFMATYAGYYVIKQYMIDPYYEKQAQAQEEN